MDKIHINKSISQIVNLQYLYIERKYHSGTSLQLKEIELLFMYIYLSHCSENKASHITTKI